MKKEKFDNMLIIFIIGCFIGWIYEEIFYFLTENIITNRGFLYGPYLPVYGIGAVLIYLFLRKYKNKPVLVFTLSMLITGIVEYLVGTLLWVIYHKVWWTYDGLFLNIGGYVCLRSVISFAIGAMFLIYLIVPYLEKNKNRLKFLPKTSYCVLGTIFVDFILTLLIRY